MRGAQLDTGIHLSSTHPVLNWSALPSVKILYRPAAIETFTAGMWTHRGCAQAAKKRMIQLLAERGGPLWVRGECGNSSCRAAKAGGNSEVWIVSAHFGGVASSSVTWVSICSSEPHTLLLRLSRAALRMKVPCGVVNTDMCLCRPMKRAQRPGCEVAMNGNFHEFCYAFRTSPPLRRFKH